MQRQRGDLVPIGASRSGLSSCRSGTSVGLGQRSAALDRGFMARSNKDNVDTVQMCPYPLT